MNFTSARYNIHRWIYILRFSCIKTLAQKYKTTIKKLFKKHGIKRHSKQRQTLSFDMVIKFQNKEYVKTYTLLKYIDLKDKIKKRKQNYYYALRDKFLDIEEKKSIGEFHREKYRSILSITDDNFVEKLS
jgi:hypothetical protein